MTYHIFLLNEGGKSKRISLIREGSPLLALLREYRDYPDLHEQIHNARLILVAPRTGDTRTWDTHPTVFMWPEGRDEPMVVENP